MKRIKAACICQTLHFTPKDVVAPQWAEKLVRQEVEHYIKGLERSRTQYKIVDQTLLEDGSILLKVLKQYNASPVGDYLD